MDDVHALTLSRRNCLQLAAGAGLAPAVAPVGIDFRYSPLQHQATYCFPDDPYKSLVDQRGRLLYGNPGRKGADFYPTIVEFGLQGMEERPVVRQTLDAPGVPVVTTRLEGPRGGALALITFATNRAGEGRVDNVILTTASAAIPLITVHTRARLRVEGQSATLDDAAFLTLDRKASLRNMGHAWQLVLPLNAAGTAVLLRFPQQGQKLLPGEAQSLLAEVRAWWRAWSPFGAGVEWQLPKPYDNFLRACGRNILQAREARQGRLTFQVGPTCYRGLWVVDGHFILESARYLGYEKDALEGLRTTWTYQRADGALDAGGGPEHYKDAAIAMFSTVRQCELSQDWTAFRELAPAIRRAAAFLRSRQDAAHGGLIVPGFADGGFTKGYELTNTLWALAGLRAAAGQPGMEELGRFHSELRAGLDAAVGREMVRHAAGFDYLPMVMKEDPAWQRSEWERPRPQTAQWALSQAIYPGVEFEAGHAVVKGHMELMKACTQEDVPIETGWLPHGGLWTYNAAFAAHAYLWAGDLVWARQTFVGFLNHASPLYCWREEQPVRGSSVAGYVGDMPHNWASAECVLYLRHMLAMEDGQALRLLAGVGKADLAFGEPFRVRGTPTRFGVLDMELTPERRGWRLTYRRGRGPAPGALRLPAVLGGRLVGTVQGAKARVSGEAIEVDPGTESFTATWYNYS
ncbi:MAG TPA: hypothetical protein VGK29_21035 [Paludibaculum sp.]|jgi:hypothetical protein